MKQHTTQIKVFYKTLLLQKDNEGSYTSFVGDDLSKDINDWLAERGVQPLLVSPANFSFPGRDQEQRLVMIASVSVLYLTEEEVDESQNTSSDGLYLGPLGDLLRTFQERYLGGKSVGDVVEVVASPPASSRKRSF